MTTSHAQPNRSAHRRPSSRGARETWRFYEQNASVYAASTEDPSRGVPVEGFLAVLPIGPRVVDLGSGSGRDLRALRLSGADALGLDLSPALADIARRRSGAPVIVADMTWLPFADGSFDGAWASASLLHLGAIDMRRALAEVRRVLRPGGVLMTSMKTGKGRRREPCGRWFSYVEPSEWRDKLRASGFGLLSSNERVETRVGDGAVCWSTCLAQRL